MAARVAPILHVAVDVGPTGDGERGPTVVMLHGIASSSVTFENVIPLISPTHRVLAIDLLGFGESPTVDDGEYTLDEHVAALSRTLDGLRLKGRIVLVGHSMGSLIATRYAAIRPASIRHLVLVSPPIYVPPDTLADPRYRTAQSLYLRAYEYLRGNQRFTMRAAKRLAALSPIPNVLDVSERNWRAFVFSLRNSIESQTTISDLAAVRAPVDIVYGALDPFLIPAGLKIAERFEHVTMHRVAGMDHVIRPRLAREVATAIDADPVGSPA